MSEISAKMAKYRDKEYPAIAMAVEGILGPIEYIFSVRKILQGYYNGKDCIAGLIDALAEGVKKTDKFGNKTAIAKAIAAQLRKSVHIFPDGTIHKNPWNKNQVSAQVIKYLADKGILKPTDTSWLVGGQLAENGTAEGLEAVLQDCPTKEVIEALFDWGYLNSSGIIADKVVGDDKLNVLMNTYNQIWFKETLDQVDFNWLRLLNRDPSKTISKSIKETRESIDHFRGEDLDEAQKPDEGSELNRLLKDSKDYGYNLENLGFAIARITSLDKMVMNHPVFSKYPKEVVKDFLWKSGNTLVLNEICHVEELATKLENLKKLNGDEFFIELFNILNTTKGLSNDMIQVRKALKTYIIDNLNQKDRIYSKTSKTNSNKKPDVITYGQKFEKVQMDAKKYASESSCTDTIQRALASYGMYGAGKKSLSDFYDEDLKTFYPLDWEIETDEETLFVLGIEFEKWCNHYFESKNEDKQKARQAAENERTIDSKRGTVVLSLNELVRLDDASDDLAMLNDPNFSWNLDYDLAF